MNQEGVIISYQGDSPKRIFTAIAHLFFILFAHFVYIAHLTKFTKESSLLIEKSLLIEISKAEENPWLTKKETEKQALRGNKEYHSVKKRKKSSVKATGIGEAPRWRPDLEQRSRVKTKFAIHKFQIEVSYYS